MQMYPNGFEDDSQIGIEDDISRPLGNGQQLNETTSTIPNNYNQQMDQMQI